MKKLFLALVAFIGAFVYSIGEKLNDMIFSAMARSGLIATVVTLPNGSLIAIASGYGASKEMSAISNAAEAVATLEASHGVVENDILEITSGWARLNNKIVRADSVSTNDVTLEDIVTSDTSIYPAGSGTGTVREITGWTQLSQILSVSSNGGEQQFLEYQFLESDAQVRIPTFKSAAGLTLSLADDPDLAGFILALAANDDRAQRAVRITLANGAILYYNAYVSVNKTPSLNVNEIMAVELTLSLLAEPVRYAS